MNCTDFERAFQEQLDARRDELPPELRDHQQNCPACRAFCSEQRAVLALTRSWVRPTPPAHLIDAVLVELATTTPSRVRAAVTRPAGRGSMWGMVCSAAAMLMLAAALWRSPPEAGRPIAQQEPAPPTAKTEIVSETLSGLFRGMTVEYSSLPAGTSRAWPELRELPESAELLQDFPPARTPTLEPNGNWNRWDRPVSDRVGQAFDFLWEALPRTPPQSS